MGHPGFVVVSGEQCRFTHLSDDRTVAKMGYPDLWWFEVWWPGLWGSELLGEVGEVHVVPAVHDLAVVDVDEGAAAQGGLFVGCGEAKCVAGVGHVAGPADCYAVVFDDEVFDDDLDAGEGAFELAVDGFEGFGTDEVGVGVGEAVCVAPGMEELVDGGFVALVPDFFKPAYGEGSVLLRHDDTSGECVEGLAVG
jgi:hypothetical protein